MAKKTHLGTWLALFLASALVGRTAYGQALKKTAPEARVSLRQVRLVFTLHVAEYWVLFHCVLFTYVGEVRQRESVGV